METPRAIEATPIWAQVMAAPDLRRCPPEVAMRLAERIHIHGTDRYGAPLMPHVRRVAAAVPVEARAVAWLHEALESSAVSADDLRAAGVGTEELAAIRLLTRDREGDEADYLAHVALIARAAGGGGRLARIVKRADLLDRMTHVVAGAGVPARPPHMKGLALLSAFWQCPTGRLSARSRTAVGTAGTR